MSPQSENLILTLAAIVLSAPVLLASIKALVFFGTMTRSVENLKETFEKGERKIEAFTEQLQQTIDDHEGRITTIEAERRMEAKFGRRMTDPVVQAAQQLAATDKELHNAR